MKRVSEYLFLWALGGSIYYELEMMFRGFSHWSMFVLGGICMVFFAIQGRMSMWRDPLIFQITRCTIFVVSMEFITGMIVNKWLRLNVWDYSQIPLNLFGQICLPFALLFSLLSLVGIWVCIHVLHLLYGEEKPQFPPFLLH